MTSVHLAVLLCEKIIGTHTLFEAKDSSNSESDERRDSVGVALEASSLFSKSNLENFLHSTTTIIPSTSTLSRFTSLYEHPGKESVGRDHKVSS